MGKMNAMLIEMQETPIIEVCPECDGSGEVEVDFINGYVDRYPDTRMDECEECHGSGEVYRSCEECGDPVTMYRGSESTICEECADED